MLDWLAHRAQISPHKIALIAGEQSFTYRQLNALTARLCAQLAAAGIEPGQHVAALLPNQAEFVALIHALARLGAVLVPLNTRLTAAELRWQVTQADCRAVVCSRPTEAAAAELHQNNRLVLPVEALPPVSTAQIEGWQSRPLNLEAVQGIIFTSGTTGQPKGAMLTFGNHFWSATASAFGLGVNPADRWLLCMPLYHVGGLAIVLRCCLYGAAVVILPGFEPAAVGRALAEQSVSLISVVPTMLHRLLDAHPGGLAAPHLRCVLVGGAALPPALAQRCRELGLPIAASYGLSEAASQVATALPGAPPTGSVGQPLLFLAVRVVDAAGNRVPTGQIGEIVVSGPTVMAGYYGHPTATQQALRGGELFTGDLGYLDEAGELWVVQRRADLIVSGGENVYPAEVERVLQAHPAVAEACVVGLPHAEWGQLVAAAVVLRAGQNVSPAEIIGFCRAQLAGYKLPRVVQFVAALPQTASGKVRREEVRQSMLPFRE